MGNIENYLGSVVDSTQSGLCAWKIGRKRFVSVEDRVEPAVIGLVVYIHNSDERLIQAAKGDKMDE